MHLSRNTFDRLVEAAIGSLPEEFARWIDRVPIIVEDRPQKGQEEEPLGEYHGPLRPVETEDDSGQLPPRIMLYREPLMDACDTREQLAEEIRKTLLHELGHHAGMDEEELDALGYGPIDEQDDDIEWEIDDRE
jgi:predicted Zn-dependent protease with MMP-like domain